MVFLMALILMVISVGLWRRRSVRREYHRHIVFARSPEVERRGILEGERARGDGIRTLDLCHAADERADFTVVGSHLKLSAM